MTGTGARDVPLRPVKVDHSAQSLPGNGGQISENGSSQEGKLTVQTEQEKMRTKLLPPSGSRNAAPMRHVPSATDVDTWSPAGAQSQDQGLSTLELFGLQKVFKGKPDFWALKGSWFSIEEVCCWPPVLTA